MVMITPSWYDEQGRPEGRLAEVFYTSGLCCTTGNGNIHVLSYIYSYICTLEWHKELANIHSDTRKAPFQNLKTPVASSVSRGSWGRWCSWERNGGTLSTHWLPSCSEYIFDICSIDIVYMCLMHWLPSYSEYIWYSIDIVYICLMHWLPSYSGDWWKEWDIEMFQVGVWVNLDFNPQDQTGFP